MPRTILIACILPLSLAGCDLAEKRDQATEWPVYGGSQAGDHFSPLTQITPANVTKLSEAWRFETGPGGLHTSPLMIDETVFAMSPDQSVLALDAASGKLRWKTPIKDAGGQPVRGLSYWREGSDQRLLVGTGHWLSAINPEDGKIISSFGQKGRVDLREGFDRPASEIALAMTSPGVVWNDTIIVGFRTTESKPAAPGSVRAFDVRSGALKWTFNLIPRPGETGSESWPADALQKAGGANNWAGMVIDEKRGIVFVPTGSASDDFYGADRHGDNLFANSLVAINATTGKRIWHQQLVHHDLLDRDLPSPPVLLTVMRAGKAVDAVAQATKHGQLFLFERATGKPLFDIKETSVPISTVPGEKSSPTQPLPVLPEPFARQKLTREMLTERTPAANAAVRREFDQMISAGPFAPLSVSKTTVVFPGYDGGAEWGGQAVDPAKGIVFVNANDIPWTGRLASACGTSGGEAIYLSQCAACHGVNMKGVPGSFPSLEGIFSRVLDGDVFGTIMNGKGRMPAIRLSPPDVPQLFDYLRTGPQGGKHEMATSRAAKSRYIFTGYKRFVDPDGYPAVKPPWGTMSAIDMNSGRTLWRVPLGSYPELAAKGMPNTGSDNYGGPLLTAGGVLFIGATVYDRQFRAFDPATGKVLWQTSLPYAGAASPITYSVKGRQFVLIATSASRDPKAKPGSAYVAFALK